MRTMLHILMLASSLLASGCVTPVAPIIFEELGVAPLSKLGCPDLTGAYRHVFDGHDGKSGSDLFFVFLAGQPYATQLINQEARSTQSKQIKVYDMKKGGENTVYVMTNPNRGRVVIKHNAHMLQLVLTDETDFMWAKSNIRLDTPDTGCRDGALVLRWRKLAGGGDFTSTTQSYGEIQLKKEPDGSLLYSTWSNSRDYSSLVHTPSLGMGKPMQTWRVKPVPQ